MIHKKSITYRMSHSISNNQVKETIYHTCVESLVYLSIGVNISYLDLKRFGIQISHTSSILVE